MNNFFLSDFALGLLCIFCSVIIDVFANICLKKSCGFKHKLYGILAILCLMTAMAFLAITIRLMDLSIAYALFGSFALLLTTIIDKLFFGVKLNAVAITGVFVMICGVILLKVS